MIDFHFSHPGTTAGVLALDSIAPIDCLGITIRSFDTTNTGDVALTMDFAAEPARQLDATLREAFDRYDDLLRRLAD